MVHDRGRIAFVLADACKHAVLLVSTMGPIFGHAGKNIYLQFLNIRDRLRAVCFSKLPTPVAQFSRSSFRVIVLRTGHRAAGSTLSAVLAPFCLSLSCFPVWPSIVLSCGQNSGPTTNSE
jgi:hypothetical protein